MSSKMRRLLKNSRHWAVLLAAMGLVACASEPLGSLYWGVNQKSGKAWLPADLVAERAKKTKIGLLLDKEIIAAAAAARTSANPPVLTKINREGILPNDPEYTASDEGIQSLKRMFWMALCARIGSRMERDACFPRAREWMGAWVKTYSPTGNPINENELLPLILAIDLQNKSNVADSLALNEWLQKIISSGDRFYENLAPKSTKRKNNFNSWRLALRALASQSLRDIAELEKTKESLGQHTKLNLGTPDFWKPDARCSNRKNEQSYGSFDFQQRDALHYHLYNLKAYVFVKLFAPETLSAQSQDQISRALSFMRPYFEGSKQHIEFVCTGVVADLQRAEAKIPGFVQQPWRPERAKNVLWLARGSFPEIVQWTERLRAEKYDPFVALLAWMHGGVQTD